MNDFDIGAVGIPQRIYPANVVIESSTIPKTHSLLTRLWVHLPYKGENVMSDFFAQQLLEYPGWNVRESHAKEMVDRCVEQGGGAIRLFPRWSGRPFTKPAKWVKRRLCADALRPSALAPVLQNPFTMSEWWLTNTIPIPTGAVVCTTGEAPFRDGICHAADTSGYQVMEFQQMIEASPLLILGSDVAATARQIYGRPTMLVTVKRFTTSENDDADALPAHDHSDGLARKPEIHIITNVDNPDVSPHHSYAHAIGLKTRMTRDDFLRCMTNWESNEILDWLRWYRMGIGTGAFHCPPELIHKPGAGTTVEFHPQRDQHRVYQAKMVGCQLTMKEAMGAAPKYNFPNPELMTDPEHVTSLVNFPLNQQSDEFIDGLFRRSRRADEYCDDGVEATWDIHGPTDRDLPTSSLRLVVQPGASTILRGLPSSGAFFLSAGAGRVCKLNNRFLEGINFDGSPSEEAGWITDPAIKEGVPVTNTGSELMVVTFGFQAEVHLK